MGIDRLVNAVAAHAHFPQGAIVVDFGTATTFDVVAPDGDLKVAPSPQALKQGQRH